jgi:hypothetical protein
LTWSFPKPISKTNKPPKDISLKNLIDTRRHTLFIFVCFGRRLDSGCWATNQGCNLPLKSKSMCSHQLGWARLDLLKSECWKFFSIALCLVFHLLSRTQTRKQAYMQW